LEGRNLVFEDGSIYTLYEWIDGSVFTPGQSGQLASAGEMLGRMHRVGGEPAKVRKMARLRSVDVVDEIGGVLNAVLQMDGRARCIGEVLSARLDWVASEIVDDLPLAVIHGDYRAQNLLFEREGIVGVLDLDAACVSPRLLDLCYALVFFQAVVADRPLDRAALDAFWNGYTKPNLLTSEEYMQLPFWLELAVLKGLALWMRIAFVDRVNPQVEGWFAPYLDLLAQVEEMVGWLRNGRVEMC